MQKLLILSALPVLVLTACTAGDKQMTDFEECAAAGNPVMESHPPQCRTKDGKTFVQDIGNELEKAGLIRVDFPRPNATVGPLIKISGQARGFWFFEASFPVIVENENGKVIAAHYAAAKGDWMTEEFVPFTSELKVDFEDSTAGTLVLKKDNPSGLPENDDELRIPLLFDSTIADSATDINYISAWNHPVLDAWIKHMKEYESDFGLDQMEISKVSPINVDSSGKVEEGFPEAITSDPPDGSLSLAVSARGESPDSEVFLIDNDNNFKRVLFCGTPCRWDGGGWISDSMFFVAGMNEDFETSTVESVSFRPVLYVFDLEADTMTTYYGPIVIPDTI